MQKSVFLLLLLFHFQILVAQTFEILIEGGHVIDPKNNLSEILDVAINQGKIIKVAKSIDPKKASQVIDARGMYVVPGLIDLHTHVFYGPDPDRNYCDGTKSVLPDAFTFPSGVTTVVDAGSSGWKDFPVFKKNIIDVTQTRVLAFLNIVGAGMRGSIYEQDTTDMDGKKAAIAARQYREFIVGIKVAHYKGSDWKPVDEAVNAGDLANIPIMIDFGSNPSPLSIKELFLKRMRPEDIFTHCFAELKGREPIVDTLTKKLKAFVWEAKKRGIFFDVGYGGISLSFSQAIPAIKAGFYPNTISTDMHAGNKYKMKDILYIMSEFLALGMNIQDVIGAVTRNPAKEIKHEELGNISVGATADIAIVRVLNNRIEFSDHTGYKIKGTKKFECEMTISNGKIVYRAN
jgi:dihydroorotase